MLTAGFAIKNAGHRSRCQPISKTIQEQRATPSIPFSLCQYLFPVSFYGTQGLASNRYSPFFISLSDNSQYFLIIMNVFYVAPRKFRYPCSCGIKRFDNSSVAQIKKGVPLNRIQKVEHFIYGKVLRNRFLSLWGKNGSCRVLLDNEPFFQIPKKRTNRGELPGDTP